MTPGRSGVRVRNVRGKSGQKVYVYAVSFFPDFPHQLVRISGFASLFSAFTVFLHPPTKVLKILRSLGKSRGIRELEKAVAVRKSLLEKFPLKVFEPRPCPNKGGLLNFRCS